MRRPLTPRGTGHPRPFIMPAVAAWCRRIVSAVLMISVLAGCGGRAASIPPLSGSMPAGAAPGTAILAGSLKLPAGMTIAPATLTVANSVGSASVAASGAFSISAFAAGPQLTMVQNAAGSTLLMGWLGANEPQLNVHTTAEVLAYYAASLYLVPNPDRQTAMNGIASLPQLAQLESALSASLIANPDSLDVDNPGVAAALKVVAAALAGSGGPTASALRARGAVRSTGRRGSEILVQPPNHSTSGLTLVNDEPTGVHFVNSYRRRAKYAVVDDYYLDQTGAKISVGQYVPTGSGETLPVVGLGTTVTTLMDITKAYFGEGTSAYAPRNGDPIALSVRAGATSEHYTVKTYGPGRNDGDFNLLTADEKLAQDEMTWEFLWVDFFVPLIVSALLPNIYLDRVFSTPSITFSFIRDAATLYAFVSKQTEYGEFVNCFQADLNGTDCKNAIFRLYTAVVGSTIFRDVLLTMLNDLGDQTIGFGVVITKNSLTGSVSKLLSALRLADATLAVADASALITSLELSNKADVFGVDVTPTTIKLSPAATQLPFGQTVTLTAVAPSLGGSGLSLAYAWSNTAQFGHLTDGQNGHADTFTSTSNAVTYTGGSTTPGTDTISVEISVIQGQNRISVGTAKATVTVGSLVTLSPAAVTLDDAQGQVFTATVAGPPPGATLSYHWSNTAGFGHLHGPEGTDAFSSASNTATYVSTSDPTLNGADTIAVEAFATVNGQSMSLGKSSAMATVARTLCNGDFASSPTLCWSFAANGLASETWGLSAKCFPAQNNNRYVSINTGGTGEGTLAQTFRVPLGATALTLRSWAFNAGATATVSIVNAAGAETQLDSYAPPAEWIDTKATCSPSAPQQYAPSYPIATLAGQTITLKLRAAGGGGTSADVNWDDIAIK